MVFSISSLKKFFSLCAIFLIWSFTACAEPVEVGLLEFPPSIRKDGNGKPVGTFVDNLKKILKEANVDYEMNFYPVKRMILYMMVGKLDLGIGRDKDSMPAMIGLRMLWTKNSITTIRTTLCSINGLPVRSIADVKGKKLLMKVQVLPDEIDEFLKNSDNRITVDESRTFESAVKKLLLGRGDYLIIPDLPLESILEKNPDLMLKAKNLGLVKKTINERPIHLLLNKSTPDADALLARLDKAIVKLKADGIFK